MKRTAISIVLAIIALYALQAFGPTETRQALSTRTNAQELFKQTNPDPFAPDSGGGKKAAKQPDAAPLEPVDGSLNKTIEAELSKLDNFEFPDVSLQDAVDILQAKHGIQIIIDRKALEDSGIGTDKVININLRGIRIDKFLDLMTSELELTWTLRDGLVVITTQERLAQYVEVRVYNCADLIEVFKGPPPSISAHREEGGGIGGGGFGGGGRGGGGLGGGGLGGGGFGGGGFGGAAPAPANPAGAPPAAGSPAAPAGAPAGQPGASGGASSNAPPTVTPAAPQPLGTIASLARVGSDPPAPIPGTPDNDSLIDLIEQTVEPDTWTNVGGHASIEVYHGGLLVISHDWRAHRRIEQLLNMMRKAKQAEPGAVVRER